jgi:hypothetical protein
VRAHLSGGLAQPGVVRRRVHGLRQPRARLIAVALCLGDFGEQTIDPGGRPELARARQRRARGRPCPGGDRLLGTRQLALELIRLQLMQTLHELQPLGRRDLPGEAEVGLGQSGVRLGLPCRLEHLARDPRLLGLLGERAGLDRDRREVRLQLVRLTRQIQRLVGPAGRALRRRLLVEQQRPPARRGLPLDQLVLGHVADRAQRLGPQPGAGLQIEQGGEHPRRVRAPQIGAPRQLERALPVALLHRLGEEAAQAKELGLVVLEHLLELDPRHALVALELGGLRAQQQGGGRMPEQLVGAPVQQLGGRAVARGGGDQTLRQSLIAPVGARAAHAPADPARCPAEQAQDLEQDDQEHSEQQ